MAKYSSGNLYRFPRLLLCTDLLSLRPWSTNSSTPQQPQTVISIFSSQWDPSFLFEVHSLGSHFRKYLHVKIWNGSWIYLLHFSFLKDLFQVLPIIQCLNIVASYILHNSIVYMEASWIQITPSWLKSEICLWHPNNIGILCVMRHLTKILTSSLTTQAAL